MIARSSDERQCETCARSLPSPRRHPGVVAELAGTTRGRTVPRGMTLFRLLADPDAEVISWREQLAIAARVIVEVMRHASRTGPRRGRLPRRSAPASGTDPMCPSPCSTRRRR